MRRSRILVLTLALAGLLLLPSPTPASAQQLPDWRIEGVVTGQTEPGTPIPTTGRTSGGPNGRFGDILIPLVIDCRTASGAEEVVVATVENPNFVEFTSDDDVTDGFGELIPTGAGAFTSTAAVEVRSDDPVPNPAAVSIGIEEGRFTRVLGVVQVDLFLTIRVERINEDNSRTEQCEHARVPARIVLELFPRAETATNGGFHLVGIVRDHNDPV